jgi:hypothetical protein
MNETSEDLFAFDEHPYRDQQQSENKKTGENYIDKKPEVGAPFVKDGGYYKEKQNK